MAEKDEYETIAEATLTRIATRIEDALEDLDVEMNSGVLTIELPNGRQYVLNKQRPTRQIWLSSPESGAWHFVRRDDGRWISTRGERSLTALLAEEFGRIGGVPISFD